MTAPTLCLLVVFGAAAAWTVVAAAPTRRVRHYRWRNRRFLKELRSDLGGRSEEADQAHPRGRSVPAGVERRAPQRAVAPPAPCPLVGAVGRQTAAPARPPRVHVSGAP